MTRSVSCVHGKRSSSPTSSAFPPTLMSDMFTGLEEKFEEDSEIVGRGRLALVTVCEHERVEKEAQVGGAGRSAQHPATAAHT